MKKQFLSVTLIAALTLGTAGTYHRFSNATLIAGAICAIHGQASH